MSTPHQVLLLRAPAGDGPPPDKYEASFASKGYDPISVPVLETVLVNLQELVQIIQMGPEKRGLGGVIITSARACEAWKSVVEQLVSVPDVEADVDWSRVPFYVVGDATAAALAAIQEIPASHGLPPRDIRGSAATGTSEKLAHFILNDSGDSKPTLLYLTGDKNRDVLPNILKDGGLALENLQVYATTGSSHFESDLQDALSTRPQDSNSWWLVYFAPSAAAFVTPILRKRFTLPRSSDEICSSNAHAYLAAIGPTTATFLHDTLGLAVHVTAETPTPEHLARAIQQYDERQEA